MTKGPTVPVSPSKAKPGELLVFFVRRDTKCGECSRDLFRGSMITLEKERGALCLTCADLDHLEYLPRGDAALTRRAAKYSALKAVVLQWSRTRQQYERQGMLVETEALARAETECLVDADARERQRQRRRVREAEIDREYVATFSDRIRQLYPKCPSTEADRIAQHACRKHSGRVGRSAAAKMFEPEMIHLSVVAAVRHKFTNYDELLLGGIDRHEARALVRATVEKQLNSWSGSKHQKPSALEETQ